MKKESDKLKPNPSLINLDYKSRSVEIKNEKLGKPFWEKVVYYQFIISLTGMITGILIVLLGAFMAFRGISGTTNWIFNILGFQSQIAEATPGIILFLLGIVIIYLTRFKINSSGK